MYKNVSFLYLTHLPLINANPGLPSRSRDLKFLFFWETDLQKSIDFLLNLLFVFRNELYVNLLYYIYTCCYTKMKKKFKLKFGLHSYFVYTSN